MNYLAIMFGNKMKNKTIKTIIDYWAEQNPNDIFLYSANNETISFAELQKSCQAFCQNLANKNIKQGESVAYALHNSIESVQVILGCLYGGYICVAINLVAGKEVIAYKLQHSEAKIVFAESDTKNLLGNFAKIEMINSNWFKVKKINEAIKQFNQAQESLLIYTSGTTGMPKGVVHTHKSLIAGGENVILAHKLTKQDIGLCSLPLYHINAFCVSLMASLVIGRPLVIAGKFSTSNFWQLIEKFSCTWFSLVPTQISYLYQYAVENGFNKQIAKTIRFGRSASSALSPELHSNFEKMFNVPIIETMGISETAAQILSNPIESSKTKIGSVGIAYGNQIRIANKNMQTAKAGEVGEIQIKGNNLMSHYRKNKNATKESFHNDWFKSGDLGYMDNEGYVFVKGRLKELIIKGGENISPREIDDVLYQNKNVIEAAAFGVPCKNYGEKIIAAVKLANTKTTEQDLINLCKEKLGEFKTPEKIYILSELPKGPSGKIQRLKLAKNQNFGADGET